jgi:hypothetical protein
LLPHCSLQLLLQPPRPAAAAAAVAETGLRRCCQLHLGTLASPRAQLLHGLLLLPALLLLVLLLVLVHLLLLLLLLLPDLEAAELMWEWVPLSWCSKWTPAACTALACIGKVQHAYRARKRSGIRAKLEHCRRGKREVVKSTAQS